MWKYVQKTKLLKQRSSWKSVCTVVPGREEERSVDEWKLVINRQRTSARDAGKATNSGCTEATHQQTAYVVVAVRSVIVQSDVVRVLRAATDRLEGAQVRAVLEDVAASWQRSTLLHRGGRRTRGTARRRSTSGGAWSFRLGHRRRWRRLGRGDGRREEGSRTRRWQWRRGGGSCRTGTSAREAASAHALLLLRLLHCGMVEQRRSDWRDVTQLHRLAHCIQHKQLNK